MFTKDVIIAITYKYLITTIALIHYVGSCVPRHITRRAISAHIIMSFPSDSLIRYIYSPHCV